MSDPADGGMLVDRSTEGELQVRVFEPVHPDGPSPYERCLFSSSDTAT